MPGLRNQDFLERGSPTWYYSEGTQYLDSLAKKLFFFSFFYTTVLCTLSVTLSHSLNTTIYSSFLIPYASNPVSNSQKTLSSVSTLLAILLLYILIPQAYSNVCCTTISKLYLLDSPQFFTVSFT